MIKEFGVKSSQTKSLFKKFHSQVFLYKVVKRQLSRNGIWPATPGKLSFRPNDFPFLLRNWPNDFFTFLSLSLWSFCQIFSLKNVIFFSFFLRNIFYKKLSTQKTAVGWNWSPPYDASVWLADTLYLWHKVTTCDIRF